MYHDMGDARYGPANTNIMESFDGNIKMICFLLVMAIIEYLFYKVVKIMNAHGNNVSQFIFFCPHP